MSGNEDTKPPVRRFPKKIKLTVEFTGQRDILLPSGYVVGDRPYVVLNDAPYEGSAFEIYMSDEGLALHWNSPIHLQEGDTFIFVS